MKYSFILTVAFNYIALSYAAFFTCSDIVEKMSDCRKLTETRGSFEVRGIKITYWVYEDQENLNPTMDPVILIHGGPGDPSLYMEPLKQLACRGRKVIRYDQDCVGESFVANVTENAPFLLDLDYYPKELYALIDHLGLKSYHVLGHSWGTIVGQEFAMTEPKGMSGLILVGALSSGKFYIESQRKERHSTLPPHLQKILKQFEETGEFDSPLYAAVNEYLRGLWSTRLIPVPDCVEKAFARTNQEIYVAINGASEFTMSGTLWDWDVTGKVDGNKYPTIVIGGEFDTMTYDCLKKVADGIENSELKIIPNAAHMCFIDFPDLFMDIAQEFMIKHDSQANEKMEL
ncbi:proline iminopeptidase-like [Convolutriloba macropyga]|uniref:proline iminopeptidase-like n=1 Tax=Convolutriloba macropyga TaxID=536237 RepID=UPI003F51C45C